MTTGGKLLYKPVGLVGTAVAGAAAGLVFREVWRAVAGEKETPQATDEWRGWSEILLAAAIQGAILAMAKAAVRRGGAAGVRRLTGRWPE